jgi:hypothetical protein
MMPQLRHAFAVDVLLLEDIDVSGAAALRFLKRAGFELGFRFFPPL